MKILEAINLTKNYKRKAENISLKQFFCPQYEIVKAVNGINFSVEEGEIIGYVGPNGCGKSTTIKMLCGIMQPTSGQVLINGMEPTKNRIINNMQIGAIFGNRSQLWWDLPVKDSFQLYKKMYCIDDNIYRENLTIFDEILGLNELLDIPERQLSLGQKMKCNIVVSLLHNPKIVFMDEPTLGVDYISKKLIREFIKKINKKNKTTFIVTSHDFQDIEEMCERILLINKGNLIMDSTIDKIRKNFLETKNIIITTKKNILDLANKLNETAGNIQIIDKNCLSIEYNISQNNILELLEGIDKQNNIVDISVQEKGIEEIISEIINTDNK